MKTRLIIAAILFLNFTLQAQEANKKMYYLLLSMI